MLPPNCILRPATANDIGTIRRLVLSAMLDPAQLRWSQFWVIEHDGDVIACGQLRNFPAAQELGSVVVAPDWRGQGLGSHLIQHLIQQSNQPLYLECVGKRLAQFYTRFSFAPVSWRSLPPSLQRKFGLSTLAGAIGLPITIMGMGSGE